MAEIMEALSSEASAIVRALADTQIGMVAHVPSSAIASIILHELAHVGEPGVPDLLPVGREEEAIGIVGAMNLAGGRAAVLMQDNGFGNALTALTTWAVAYHLPLPIFANERGGLGEYNSMIHTISGSARGLLGTVGIPTLDLSFRESAEQWHDVAVEAIDHAWLTRRPVVVFMNFWKGGAKDR
jgi:sulfopyruvate decarboxylase subunit alpha